MTNEADLMKKGLIQEKQERLDDLATLAANQLNIITMKTYVDENGLDSLDMKGLKAAVSELEKFKKEYDAIKKFINGKI